MAQRCRNADERCRLTLFAGDARLPQALPRRQRRSACRVAAAARPAERSMPPAPVLSPAPRSPAGSGQAARCLSPEGMAGGNFAALCLAPVAISRRFTPAVRLPRKRPPS